MRKPATLAEIRESVSFLIEEPAGAALIPYASDPEDNLDENDAPSHIDISRRSSNPVINRLSLKRAESASLSTTSRLAFADPNALPQPGFKIPSLLRRSTTQVTGGADVNGISVRGEYAGTERAAGGGEQKDFVRRGGTKKSSVNWYAREMERKKGVLESEKRREEGRRKVGEMRRGVLGVLGAGKFD
jgi:mediator of replication checkpoint protein 1